ncbi:hypothetical protein SKAU_G00368480 [Synaphobranchus kaupii]|uniref:Uncharacterized protein n=1 Tax=Synaphobranchus kaupii TaxID=118154 RepID=A0A9Q1EFJ7_SYNKA|nr:hypothetical protein SKAU_G00368480 [Synaphobranchus kaupii]
MPVHFPCSPSSNSSYYSNGSLLQTPEADLSKEATSFKWQTAIQKNNSQVRLTEALCAPHELRKRPAHELPLQPPPAAYKAVSPREEPPDPPSESGKRRKMNPTTPPVLAFMCFYRERERGDLGEETQRMSREERQREEKRKQEEQREEARREEQQEEEKQKQEEQREEEQQEEEKQEEQREEEQQEEEKQE